MSCRDLVQRDLLDILYRDLAKRSLREILPRDLLERSRTETLHRDLLISCQDCDGDVALNSEDSGK